MTDNVVIAKVVRTLNEMMGAPINQLGNQVRSYLWCLIYIVYVMLYCMPCGTQHKTAQSRH